jgi:prealbumin domain-containing protein
VSTLGDGDAYTITQALPGTWAVTETVPSAWALSNLTCVSSGGSSTYTKDLSKGTLSVNMAPDDLMTCTFTNRKQGFISVTKATVPAGGVGFKFDSPPVTLDDGLSALVEITASQTYTLLEANPMAVGYALTDITCNDNQGGASYDIQLDQRQVVINGTLGLNANCTYTNTKLSTLVIVKKTLPGGDTQKFDFAANNPKGQPVSVSSLGNGDAYTITQALPGTWAVTETVPSNWALSNLTCVSSGGSSTYTKDLSKGTLSVNLAPDDLMTCTFTNQQQGRIRVDKVTDPSGSKQSFSFSLTGTGVNRKFSLTDADAPYDSGMLAVGAYSVVETTATGWMLESAVCDSGDDPSNINLAFGATVTCTFTNKQDPVPPSDRYLPYVFKAK